MTDTEIVELFCSVLRDGADACSTNAAEATADRLLGLADLHGIASLLHAELGACESLPPAIRDGLRERALGWAMYELGERQALGNLISALVDRGVRPLLFKGAALAYSHYPDPALRQRSDADILVAQEERAAALEALGALGWRRASKSVAEVSIGQASYRLDGPGGAIFQVDLHWRISNSRVLQRIFDHEHLWRRSILLPALHARARGAGSVDAMLIACMHRLWHLQAPFFSDDPDRDVSDRLIWLYDIRLLAAAFTPEDWAEFRSRAREIGLSDCCREGLLLAKKQLGAPCPDTVLAGLAEPGSKTDADAYLRASRIRREWMDFCAVPRLGGKLRYLGEIVLPPAAYMREGYDGPRDGWLPWLYLRRATRGIAKRLRGRQDATSSR